MMEEDTDMETETKNEEAEGPSGDAPEEDPEGPESTGEEDKTTGEKLRLAKNQLNIANAFLKEESDVEQISQYAGSALSLLDELLKARPGDDEIISLRKQAERMMVMCSYSSSHLDDLLKLAKEQYSRGKEKMRLGHELQARWYFEKSLDRLQPVLVLWGVSEETKEIVEDTNEMIEELDEETALGERKNDLPEIFNMLDRLSSIADSPLQHTIHDDSVFEELNMMRDYFLSLNEDTHLDGLREVFEDIDRELFYYYVDRTKHTLERIERINILHDDGVLDKLEDLMREVGKLYIDDGRKQYVLEPVRKVKAKYIKYRKGSEQFRKAVAEQHEIFRGVSLKRARRRRLKRMLEDIYDRGEESFYTDREIGALDRMVELLLKNAPVWENEEGDAEGGESIEETGGVGEAEGETAEETETKGEKGEEKRGEAEDEGERGGKKRGKTEDEGGRGGKKRGKTEDEGERGGGSEERGGVHDLSTKTLLSHYQGLLGGEERGEIDLLLDAVTGDFVFKTLKDVPKVLTLEDDVKGAIEELRKKNKILRTAKAYLPFTED